MKSSREQFEEWVKAETGFDLYRTNFPMTSWDNQQYKDHSTNLAWMSWQASRAAIEIELPSKGEPADFFCEVYSCDMVHESLANCGIKVKS